MRRLAQPAERLHAALLAFYDYYAGQRRCWCTRTRTRRSSQRWRPFSPHGGSSWAGFVRVCSRGGPFPEPQAFGFAASRIVSTPDSGNS